MPGQQIVSRDGTASRSAEKIEKGGEHFLRPFIMPISANPTLETNHRAERDPQVVMCIVEIHLVADIQAQAYGSGVSFESASRIKRAHDVVVTQVGDGTREGPEGGRRVVQPEIYESALGGYERLKGV